MGYATLHGNTWQDELFIANRNTLAKLNTDTFQVETLGSLPSQSELTGNSRGELFGVFPLEAPAQIMELDRHSGQPLSSITLKLYAFTNQHRHIRLCYLGRRILCLLKALRHG